MPRARSWTDEQLAAAVAASKTLSEVCRRLGIRQGKYDVLRRHIARLGLDASHIPGSALGSLLVKGSTYRSNGYLRQRLIAAGLLQPQCAECGLTSWHGEPLPLHLDHINGDHTDNRLENLRILCPNCHAITKTWCRRKKKPA